jgi:DNA-binding transcriptional LysR family regulator
MEALFNFLDKLPCSDNICPKSRTEDSMDRVDSLRVFLRVVDCLSFTAAAHQLQLPRSTVSTAIRDLENRLGVRLLTRSTRTVVPTQDGLAFYDRCDRVLSDFEELETLFQEAATPLSGRLSVNVPGRMARLIFAPSLPEFVALYPAIQIELGATDREVDLIQEGIDCVVRVGDLADSSLVARPLGTLPMVNCAAPAYIARHGTPRTLDDLAEHAAVGYASPTTGRIERWEVQGAGGIETVPVRAQVTVNHAEGLIACGLAGLGMIQVPAYDVREHLREGALVELLPDARAAPMPLNIIYPHRRHLSRRLKVFMDWAEAIIRRYVTP